MSKWCVLNKAMFIPLSTRIIAIHCLLLPPLWRPDSAKPWTEWKVWRERGRMPRLEKKGQRLQWSVFWRIWGRRTSYMRSLKRSLDDAVSLSAVEMSSGEAAEELSSPFANISAIVWELPSHMVWWPGRQHSFLHCRFVVQQVLWKLPCNMCHASLVKDAVPTSFYESYHLLTLKK